MDTGSMNRSVDVIQKPIRFYQNAKCLLKLTICHYQHFYFLVAQMNQQKSSESHSRVNKEWECPRVDAWFGFFGIIVSLQSIEFRLFIHRMPRSFQSFSCLCWKIHCPNRSMPTCRMSSNDSSADSSPMLQCKSVYEQITKRVWFWWKKKKSVFSSAGNENTITYSQCCLICCRSSFHHVIDLLSDMSLLTP